MTHTIEWTDKTINFFSGCKHNCEFCYAKSFSKRLAGYGAKHKTNGYSEAVKLGLDSFDPLVHWDVFERISRELARARLPKRVFLGSMADLGGKWDWRAMRRDCAPNGFKRSLTISGEALRCEVKRLIESLPVHVFQLLTKRPVGFHGDWPTNAHVGVSVTNNSSAKRATSLLRGARAGVLWASVEPLLDRDFDPELLEYDGHKLDWIVVGAQTGPGAPMPEITAAMRVVRYAQDRGIPCFVKHNLRAAAVQLDWPTEVVGY